MVTVSCCASAPEAVKTASREVRINLFIYYVLFTYISRATSASALFRKEKGREATQCAVYFWIHQLSPCLPTKFEFGFSSPSRVAVHNVGTFQASTTWSSAQGGIGELVLMLDLTTECRMPRNFSMAYALNSP